MLGMSTTWLFLSVCLFLGRHLYQTSILSLTKLAMSIPLYFNIERPVDPHDDSLIYRQVFLIQVAANGWRFNQEVPNET